MLRPGKPGVEYCRGLNAENKVLGPLIIIRRSPQNNVGNYLGPYTKAKPLNPKPPNPELKNPYILNSKPPKP